MAVGFPAKTTFANGNVLNASDLNDIAGTLNLLSPVGQTSGKVLAANGSGGVTWADAPVPKSTVTTKGDLVAATGSAAVTRVGVGTDGQVLTADSTQTAGVKWATPSSGAITWTQRGGSVTMGNGAIYTIAYNGSNLYVAAGQGGILYTSPDGITWTSRTSGFGIQDINKVTYGNSLWVAVGLAGLISTSTDGVTWTARTSNMGTNAIYDVAYGNGLFVAVGATSSTNGGITTSPDGTTWTKRNFTGTNSFTFYSIARGATYWVAGHTTNGASQYSHYSTDGITWTAQNPFSNNGCEVIRYDSTNSRWIGTTGSSFYWSDHAYANTAGGSYSAVSPQSNSTSGAGRFYWTVASGRVYVSRQVYETFSTSVNATTGVGPTDKTVPTFAPGSYGNAVSPYIAEAGPGVGICVTASGVVVGTQSGQIFTSF